MSVNRRSQSFSREGAAHIELGRLLKRERDESGRKIVERILASDLDTEDKVKEIERADSHRQELEVSGDRPEEQAAHPLRIPLSVLKTVIKNPHAEASYMSYLFDHHRRCRDFGRASDVFAAGLFPPRVRLNPRLEALFGCPVRSDALETIRMCDAALEHGWRYLGKREYNLIALLQRLCYEIEATNFRVLDYQSRHLVTHFRTIETLFMALHYRSEYPGLLIESLDAVLAKNPSYEQEAGHTEEVVGRLLYPDRARPSLHDFLLGLNMRSLRRYVTLDDLLCRELGEIINTRLFACLPDTRREIRTKVDDLTEELERLRQEREQLRHAKSVVPMGEDGEVDLSQLRRFYEGPSGGRGGDEGGERLRERSFSLDSENAMVFAPRLLKVFDQLLYPLLNDRIQLAGVGTVHIFPPDHFHLEFHRIRNLSGQLIKTAYSFGAMPVGRLRTIKEGKESPLAVEASIIRLIDEGVETMLRVAGAVESVLSSPRRKAVRTKDFPVSDPVIVSGRDFVLPEGGMEIQSDGPLRGLTLAAALRWIVEVSYSAAVVFHHQKTVGVLGREQRLNRETARVVEELQRLADPRTLRDIRDHVSRPSG